MTPLPPAPPKRIQKIRLCWNIWELLKDLTHKQYISSLPVKASEPLLRTGSSLTMFITDIQKAAEVRQMLRQDGAWWRPPRQNEVRYKIKFLEAQSYKRATKILIYLLGLRKLDTSVGGGKRNPSSQTVKRGLKSLRYNGLMGLSHGCLSALPMICTECDCFESSLLAVPMMRSIFQPLSARLTFPHND